MSMKAEGGEGILTMNHQDGSIWVVASDIGIETSNLRGITRRLAFPRKSTFTTIRHVDRFLVYDSITVFDEDQYQRS